MKNVHHLAFWGEICLAKKVPIFNSKVVDYKIGKLISLLKYFLIKTIIFGWDA